MRAILHIGTEKTGSTSIQYYLHRNRRRLRKAGFHLLQSAGNYNHRALPASCLADDENDDFFYDHGIDTPEKRASFRDKLHSELRRELSGLGSAVHTVIITSEHFHTRLRSAASIARLRELLKPHFEAFEIIAYLREQGQACTSWYSTSLKYGGVQSLSDFMSQCTPQKYQFDYDAVLGNWESCFGQECINVALFETQSLFEGNLLLDFAQRLQPGLSEPLRLTTKRDNESLLPEGQSLMLEVNRAFSRDDNRAAVRRIRRACGDVLYRRLRGRGEALSAAESDEIYRAFLAGNERVRQRYFPEREVLFPSPSVPTPPPMVSYHNLERTVALLIWSIRCYGWRSLSRAERETVEVNLRSVLDARRPTAS